jgi:hypothetical protein
MRSSRRFRVLPKLPSVLHHHCRLLPARVRNSNFTSRLTATSFITYGSRLDHLFERYPRPAKDLPTAGSARSARATTEGQCLPQSGPGRCATPATWRAHASTATAAAHARSSRGDRQRELPRRPIPGGGHRPDASRSQAPADPESRTDIGPRSRPPPCQLARQAVPVRDPDREQVICGTRPPHVRRAAFHRSRCASSNSGRTTNRG